jgi:hypothetical protein
LEKCEIKALNVDDSSQCNSPKTFNKLVSRKFKSAVCGSIPGLVWLKLGGCWAEGWRSHFFSHSDRKSDEGVSFRDLPEKWIEQIAPTPKISAQPHTLPLPQSLTPGTPVAEAVR